MIKLDEFGNEYDSDQQGQYPEPNRRNGIRLYQKHQHIEHHTNRHSLEPSRRIALLMLQQIVHFIQTYRGKKQEKHAISQRSPVGATNYGDREYQSHNGALSKIA
jgi:hypothetical protein